jgi:hypothetical protein
MVVFWLIDKIPPLLIMIISVVFFLIIDGILYSYISNEGVKDFNKLTV